MQLTCEKWKLLFFCRWVLIRKKFNSVSWSLSSVRLITISLLITYVKILSKSVYIYMENIQPSVFYRNFNISWNQEPRFLEKLFLKNLGAWFLVPEKYWNFSILPKFQYLLGTKNQEPRCLENCFQRILVLGSWFLKNTEFSVFYGSFNIS